jgi:hypothetical protein
MTERPLPGPGGRARFRGNLGSLVWPVPSPVTASRGGALSIVLLAILAVTWVASLPPVIAPRHRALPAPAVSR